MGATLSKLSSVTSRNSLRSDFPNTVPSSMPSPTSSPPSSPIRSIPWRQSRSGPLSHEKPITRVSYGALGPFGPLLRQPALDILAYCSSLPAAQHPRHDCPSGYTRRSSQSQVSPLLQKDRSRRVH